MEMMRDRLLSRYFEAANIIASESDTQSDEASFAAMEELLKRQAVLVAKIHDSSRGGGPEAPHEVDEELLQRRLGDLASIAMSKFYSYRYDRVPTHWRHLYTDTLILTTHHQLLSSLPTQGRLDGDVLDSIVGSLDRALITTGGVGKLGKAWIETTLQMLEEFCRAQQDTQQRPPKRQKMHADEPRRTFSDREPFGRPQMSPDKACPRYEGWALDRFEDYMNEGAGEPRPVVFTDLIADWPALTDRPWNQPDYLLSKTFGGRRLVPVEVGRSYVDEGWGQELIQFKDFLTKYIAPSLASGADDEASQQVGYLAQHNLFHQVPSLRNDITIPDFCWASVPRHPSDPSKDQPPVDTPHLNAWFGPARTITPLHTDGYHNLLCQVVGAKYVRLYPPRATPHMRVRAPEHGVDMSNTSGLDVGVLEGWDEPPEGLDDGELEEMRAGLEGVEYWECVLQPGDALVIPIGWWHYVRSLSVSFSVSFWWN